MVAIIDYGMGNVASVQKALNFLKIESCITFDFKEIERADSIILPGVGSFYQGMMNLKAKALDQCLTTEVIQNGKKFLGICLGMQLIAEYGTEPIECAGLGWIGGTVQPLQSCTFRIPHIGWNNISAKNHSYLSAFSDQDFYFIHSYHFVADKPEDIAATVDYGKEIVASVQSGNIFATQFHPEKSQNNGLKLLKTFFCTADVED